MDMQDAKLPEDFIEVLRRQHERENWFSYGDLRKTAGAAWANALAWEARRLAGRDVQQGIADATHPDAGGAT